LGQADHPVGGAQQQRPGIRRDLAAVEGRHHRAAFDACKLEQAWGTLWGIGALLCLAVKPLSQKNFRSFRGPMHPIRVRNAG
jgi:hypothetical protein